MEFFNIVECVKDKESVFELFGGKVSNVGIGVLEDPYEGSDIVASLHGAYELDGEWP